MTPDQYCEDKARQSGSSFYYSFMFLPPDKRRAITALYAFCREVDDVVDECADEHVARTTLNWWRTQVAGIYGGTPQYPQHPVAQALVPVVKQFNLSQEHLLEIIDGMEMDLNQPRYPDFKSLQLYCYRVASVVGLLAAEIFGYTDRKTLKYAHDLGIAFQLTNIIRDVGEDARRNRIYLPMDELQQFGVTAADILNAKETDNFQKLMAFQIERAQRYYKQALDQLPAVDHKSQRTGLIMAAIYQATLQEVVSSGCHVLKERVSLGTGYKLWLAIKTWLKN
jgi:phytoene synthase